jgi:single-stranded DNA-specific DHH superfamily exonuclease
MKEFAGIIAAGEAATHSDYGESISISDTLLQDALQSGTLISDSSAPVIELSPDFYTGLKIKTGQSEHKFMDIAQLIVSCCRMGKASTALATLLGDEKAYEECTATWTEYRAELNRAVQWCRQNEKSTHRFSGILIVNAQDFIASYLLGSIAAHLVKEAHPKNTFVLVIGYAPDSMIRAALRMSGRKEHTSMIELMAQMLEGIDGDYGGDEQSAGCTFRKTDEERFVSTARKVLEQAFVEESV